MGETAAPVTKHGGAWNDYRRCRDAAQSSLDARRRKYRIDYRQVLARDISPKPWGAKVNTQLTHTQIMALTDHVISALLSTWPWFAGESRELPMGWQINRGDMEAWVTAEFNGQLRQLHFYRHIRRWLRLMAIKGLGITRMSLDPTSMRALIALTDPANMLWDPEATALRLDAKWVMEEMTVTIGDLRMLAENRDSGWDAGEIEIVAQGGADVAEAPRDEAARERIEGLERGSREGDGRTLRIRDHVYPDRIVTVHDESMRVLGERPNGLGYIYYYDSSLYPEVFEIQGFSLPELMRDIYDEMCTSKRQRIDNNSLCANLMLKIRRSSGLDTYNMIARPGMQIPVNDPDDVTVLQPPQLGGALLNEEMKLENEASRLTGIGAQQRGERGEQMKATVASIMNQSANTRFGASVNDMDDYPLRPFLQDFVDIAMMRDEPAVVTRDEWMMLRRAHQAGLLNLTPRPESHIGNAFGKAQVLQTVFQLVAQHLDPIGQGEFLKRILDLVQVRDPEKITSHMLPPSLDPNTAGVIQGQVDSAMQTAQPAGQGEPARIGKQVEETTTGIGLQQELARALAEGQAGFRAETRV